MPLLATRRSHDLGRDRPTFDDHDAAIAALTAIVTAEPDAADDVFLVTQGDDGHIAGQTVYGSSLVAA